MKISIERGALLTAIGHAQSVVERRNTIPILGNVLIRAENGRVTFRATDLDVEVIEEAEARVAGEGATTVPAVTLHEIVRKLPDGATVEMALDSAAGRLTVAAGRSRFQLATLPKEDFPEIVSPDYASKFSCDAKVLRRLFEKSQFAISTEETRYYLNGVYLHVAEAGGAKVLRAVATDGHRLARIDAELPRGADDMPGVIVPRKTVAELQQAPCRRRGDHQGRRLRQQDPVHNQRPDAHLQGHRRDLPRLFPRHPDGQCQAAGGGCQGLRAGRWTGSPRYHLSVRAR